MKLVGDVAKEQIRALLAHAFDPVRDADIAANIATLIRETWEGASDVEFDEIAEAYRLAFGIALEGEGGGAEAPRARVAPFESLVQEGWFARYLEWTAEHESPSQYHFGAALVAIAAGLGRRPRIEWEARAMYPNLYGMLIGPTGARKGAAMERAVGLVQQAMGTHVLPNEGTHQGFAAALKRRCETTTKWADGLIVAPEFRVLISKDSHKSELFVWLTDWYDSPDRWERGLRGEEDPYVITNMCVSVLGGSNLAWLRTVPEDAITGGFFPRFILFNADDKRFWKARPRFDATMARELVHDLAVRAARVPEAIGFTREAGEYLDNWYEVEVRAEYERHVADERFQAWIARKQAAMMKVACVWQVVDGERVDAIEVEYLVRARRLVDWGDASVGLVYNALGVTRDAESAEDVLALVRRAGGRIPQRAIVRALSTRYDLGKIKTGLTTLEAAGIIKGETTPAEGRVWRLR